MNSHRYLSNNYAPVQQEHSLLNLKVEGEVPLELSGRFLRNGPNPIEAKDKHHWFLGDGMIHGIRLDGGKACWYKNRYVGSSNVSKHKGIAQLPGPNWNGSTTGPNTNVGGFAGKTLAMVEAGTSPVELSYDLDSIAHTDFEGTLPGALSAHPKFDPDTGQMHAACYAWLEWMDHIKYIVASKEGLVTSVVDVKLPGMSMVHDMSITKNYAIMYDQPVTIDFKAIEQGYLFPFRWQPDYGNRIGLIPRHQQSVLSQDIKWFDVPLGCSFHPMNAYEDLAGNVIIDHCQYPTLFDKDIYGPFGDQLPVLKRLTVNPSTGKVSDEKISDLFVEFPRHKHAHNGKAYRYGYASNVSSDLRAGWPTVKFDLVTGKETIFDHGEGIAAGEPVFVSKPGESEEDAGWIMTFIHNLRNDKAAFVIMDAQDLSAGYLAKIDLPRIPFGFHGNWVSDKAVPPAA